MQPMGEVRMESDRVYRRWRNWERQLRAVLCWAVFFVMIAFYLPVVAAIQALLQVSLLSVPHFQGVLPLSSFLQSISIVYLRW